MDKDKPSNRPWFCPDNNVIFCVLLLLLAALALGLRLWGLKYSLPYVYNIDEANNFLPKAVGFFSGDFNPRYFANPPAYSYLLYLLFSVFVGGREAVQHTYAVDPAHLFTIARATTAVMGTLVVLLAVSLGTRLYSRKVGLVAGLLMAVSFLPVFYSHFALNDVAQLVPLTLSLYGAAGLLTRDRWYDWPIAGAALGIAVATKYTGAIVAVPLVLALLYRIATKENKVRELAWAAATGALALAMFVVTNPYSVIDQLNFKKGIVSERKAAAEESGKLGQTERNGVLYYFWVATWAVGWIPTFAASFGGVLALVRNWRKGLFLTLYPVVYIVYMGIQGRYFGRWLMPVLPALVVLAAYMVIWLSERVPGLSTKAWGRAAALAVLVVALVLQGLIYSVHVDRVLSKTDTRGLARAWLVKNVPAGAKLVIEPVVLGSYLFDASGPYKGTPSGVRWIRYLAGKRNTKMSGEPIQGKPTVVKPEDYVRLLRPPLIGTYQRGGYCWVMIGSTQYGRALAVPADVPQAIAYYRKLKRDGKLVFEASPYKRGQGPVKFSFDWSFNFYPMAYGRPGPYVKIYQLSRAACADSP